MSATNAEPSAGEAVPGEFVISRTFDAPRERLWKAFTEAERLKHWWGPKGFRVRECKVDLRPGGLFHYCLASPDGEAMWGKFVYREIAAPERLEVIVAFSDEAGGVTRHPWAPDWPLETLSTITLAETRGGTEVTVGWAPHNATEGERRTFDESHEGMRQGWGGTFDQLAEYLAKPDEAGQRDEAPRMHAEPGTEHRWLQQLVGDWTFEAAANMGPDQPPSKAQGSETVRSLGGLWVVAERAGEMPGGGAMSSMMTLGYDPQRQRFVGTFVASMMTHLWVYEGSLDAAGTVLTLDTEGPDFAGGGTAKYQDIITIESEDRRTLTSRMLGEDSQWREVMRADYRRKA